MSVRSLRKSGFTIVELIIVIVIIGILAAITLVTYTSVQQRARDSARTVDITEVQKALERYRAANGAYPSAGADGTAYALTSLSGALVPTYLDKIPTAPSGLAYEYIRGAVGTDSYGIRMGYEKRTDCHRGVNNNTSTWWTTLQACQQ